MKHYYFDPRFRPVQDGNLRDEIERDLLMNGVCTFVDANRSIGRHELSGALVYVDVDHSGNITGGPYEVATYRNGEDEA